MLPNTPVQKFTVERVQMFVPQYPGGPIRFVVECATTKTGFRIFFWMDRNLAVALYGATSENDLYHPQKGDVYRGQHLSGAGPDPESWLLWTEGSTSAVQVFGLT